MRLTKVNALSTARHVPQLSHHRYCSLQVNDFVFPSLQRRHLDQGISHNCLCWKFPFIGGICIHSCTEHKRTSKDHRVSRAPWTAPFFLFVIMPCLGPEPLISFHCLLKGGNRLPYSSHRGVTREEKRMKRIGRVPGNLNQAKGRKN